MGLEAAEALGRFHHANSGPTQRHVSISLGATRSEIKSSIEFAQLAKLPNHLVQGEIWVVPAERMKERKEHHVPLSQEAVALISGRKGKLFLGHERQMLDLLIKLRPVTPFTAFVRASRIGRLNTIIRKSSAKWRWLILSATRWSKLIDEVRASIKGAR